MDVSYILDSGTGKMRRLASSDFASESNLVTPSPYFLNTAATTNVVLVKSTAANLYEVTVANTTAAVIYLKLFNKNVAPTLGTDVPIATIPVQPGAFIQCELGRVGKRFSSGLAIAVTGAMAATDTTAIAAGAQVSMTYL